MERREWHMCVVLALVCAVSACTKSESPATAAKQAAGEAAAPGTSPAMRFDRAGAVKRLDERLAADRKFWEKLDDLDNRDSAGEDVKKDRQALGMPPKFDDLMADARQVIQLDPADTGAFQAIQVLLKGASEAAKEESEAASEQKTAEADTEEGYRNSESAKRLDQLNLEMSRLLLEHHLGRDDLLSAADLIWLLDPAKQIAFWQDIYERAPSSYVRGNAAMRLVQQYFDTADRENLPAAEAESMRRKGMELVGVVKGEYAAEKYQPHFEPPTDQKPTLAERADRALAERAYSVGATLPDLSVVTIEGKPDRIANYRGRLILMDFWATWCGPCRAAHPGLVKFKQEMKGKPFEVIGVSVDEQPSDVLDYIKREQELPWVNWYIGPKSEVLTKWGIRGFPTYLLVDENGKVIARPGEIDAQFKDRLRALVAAVGG